MEWKNFCRVTTRSHPGPGVTLVHTGWEAGGLLRGGGRAAGARQPHVLRELRDAYDVLPAVWQPASGAPASGIPDLGSTAGSNAGADRCSHTLAAGRHARQDAGRWLKELQREYDGGVPREVLDPEGAARETLLKSLGHSYWFSDTTALNLTGLPPAAHEGMPDTQTLPWQNRSAAARNEKGKKQTRKETKQKFFRP